MINSVLYILFLKWVCILRPSGGPGCGRGTQCELVQTKTGYTHISTGEILRHEVMSGSSRGLKFYKLMAEGETVPNDDIAELIREVMFAKIIGSKVSWHSIEQFPFLTNEDVNIVICNKFSVQNPFNLRDFWWMDFL